MPRRLGVTVVFLGHDGGRWNLFGDIVRYRTDSGTTIKSFGLVFFKLRLRYAPAVAFVGTNSEVKVVEPMRDSSTPT